MEKNVVNVNTALKEMKAYVRRVEDLLTSSMRTKQKKFWLWKNSDSEIANHHCNINENIPKELNFVKSEF